MQFKHPELLYALFLLLIPIIVHLFQLRKFKKEAFTNVAFLKEVTLQTRKSSRIKKWLTLLTRMLLLAGIIIAFAQPYTTKTTHFKTESETVIYLDNSFSMQAKGAEGELLKRAVQDIISNVSEDSKISLLTNNNTYRNTTVKAIKNDLLKTDYSAQKTSYEATFLKCKALFKKQHNSIKNIVFISDFQQEKTSFNPVVDTLTNVFAVQLKPVNTQNVSIDSAYVSNVSTSNMEVTAIIRNTGAPIENLPISLYNNQTLIGKKSIAINKTVQTTFILPSKTIINGKITVDDPNLPYDNNLYFNINESSKINVLSINAADDSFLKRIFTADEFNFTTTPLDQLNYNDLEQQNIIVLNELKSIPDNLTLALNAFTNASGYLVVIPAKDIVAQSYNSLLTNFNVALDSLVNSEKRVTTINYSHSLYNNGVFEKQVKNFQYPQIQSFYNLKNNSGGYILQFEDNKPFLVQSKQVYLFTSALNDENSSFKSSPLIVPTLYNMAKGSLKIPVLYYHIGKENVFDVKVNLQQDAILFLQSNEENIIPKQQYFNNKVSITTLDEPAIAGIYALKNKNETLQQVSYNYDRLESDLSYQDLYNVKQLSVYDTISESFDTIKSDENVNELWKWFVTFALALLIIEMLILKYLK